MPMEFYLKFRATGWVLASLGFEEQHRNVESAGERVLAARPELEPDERARLCFEALAEDALCGPAWHTLGVLLHAEGRDPQAFRAFVISCIIEPWHVGPWTNAIATVPDGDSEDEQQMALLAGAVIAAAHARHGEALETALRAGMNGDDDDAKDRFMADFRALVDSVKEEEEDELELRLLSEEGDAYELITLPRS